MQTQFTAAQLADTDLRAADAILRRCVHCGFCNAACPTFALHGDELEGPRGRIWLIKDMLESGTAGSSEAVRHVDNCLSCLSCMSACPSGVDYMHLVDIGRAHVETHHRRSAGDWSLRQLLAAVLTRPRLSRLLFSAGRAALPLEKFAPRFLRPLLALLRGTGGGAPLARRYQAAGERRGSVALLAGCVQQALAPGINGAAVRLLTRLGFDVHVLEGDCCGAMEHHLGMHRRALARIRRNVRRWAQPGEPVDAILTTASGCGTMLKDYGFLLREDGELAGAARETAGRVQDIAEFLAGIPFAFPAADMPQETSVACQVPCSLRHGQRLAAAPASLLARAGFRVLEAADDHLCCGSAGTYNLLHPQTAGELGRRKAAGIAATGADVVASGNLGCMLQLRPHLSVPVVHLVELLDWASSEKKEHRFTRSWGCRRN